jgi:hypothetical protein
LEAGGVQLLERAAEVFCDEISYGPGFRADGHAEGVGMECAGGGE